ncbi:MAG: hypothetical protein ABSG32_25450 [Terriglobia bacterium]|jgi:hypothetical protein
MILKDLLETDWFSLPTGAELANTDDATLEFSETVPRDFQGRGMLCAVCQEIPVDKTSTILVYVNRTGAENMKIEPKAICEGCVACSTTQDLVSLGKAEKLYNAPAIAREQQIPKAAKLLYRICRTPGPFSLSEAVQHGCDRNPVLGAVSSSCHGRAGRGVPLTCSRIVTPRIADEGRLTHEYE